jgi:hypothetical protein
MEGGIDDLRARWMEADARAHEAENLLLAAKLVAAPAAPDPQVARTAAQLRAKAEQLRLELQARDRGPD